MTISDNDDQFKQNGNERIRMVGNENRWSVIGLNTKRFALQGLILNNILPLFFANFVYICFA